MSKGIPRGMPPEDIDEFLAWFDDEEGATAFIDHVARTRHLETTEVIAAHSGDSYWYFARQNRSLADGYAIHDQHLATKAADEKRQRDAAFEAERQRQYGRFAPTSPTIPSKQDYWVSRGFWTEIHESYAPEEFQLVQATDNFYLEFKPILRFKAMHAYIVPITMAQRLIREDLARVAIRTDNIATSVAAVRAMMARMPS